MKKIVFWLCISCCLVSFATSDCPDFIDRIVRNFTILHQARMQEKTWLHTDRTSYTAGDKIWFRAYLVDGMTHQPSPYSHFVYVELVNRQDSVLQKVKLALIDSVFSGYMDIPEDIGQGEYFLRAYSYWMQNQGEDYIYKKKIRLINPDASKVLVGITYQQEEGVKYAVFSLKNSRKEPYEKTFIHYQLIEEGIKKKQHQKRTDEKGQFRIRLDEIGNSRDIRIAFPNGLPFEFNRYVHLPEEQMDYEVAFFPEGGDLLPGNRQVIAFKAIGKDGLSVDVDGFMYDDTDSIVDVVKSVHRGMGWLNSRIEPGKKYHVVVKSSQGIEKKFYLPVGNASGIGLGVRQTDSLLAYTVMKGVNAILPDSLYLLAHVRGQLVVCIPLQERLHGKISVAEFPEGILHLCIIDSRYRVYSQRLCFVRHPESIDIQMKTNQKSYSGRELVDLELTSEKWTGGEGRFSLSVTDNITVPRDSLEDNLLIELLLNSDLKGHIEDPGFYFRDVTRTTDRCLDLLLLTQGWTRFNVGSVVAGDYEKMAYYMERGQTISGKVKNFWGKEAQEARLLLLSTNGIFNFLSADTSGYFLVDGISFPENTNFLVQARSKKGRKNVEVVVDTEKFLLPRIRMPYDRQESNGEDLFYNKYGRDYYYDQGVKVYVLDEALVRRSVPKKIYSIYDQAARYTLDSAKLAGSERDLRWVLQEIPGLVVDHNSITFMGKPILLMLNNFEEDFDRIMMMDPKQFLSISFLDETMAKFYFGPNSGDVKGALIFTENFAYMPERLKPMSLTTFTPLGYQRPVEFYVPRYEVDSVRMAMADTVDLRPTIYWNPNVKIKSSESTHIRFYTDDGCGECTFILEGVLNDGTICRKEQRMKLR